MKAATESCYEKDFYAWTVQQANLLAKKDFAHLDIINLIEEVETMGRSEKRELMNRLAKLLAHLLKWQYQPNLRSRSWELTLKEQRRKLEELLIDNPSLKANLARHLQKAYQNALVAAEKETGFVESTFPQSCPWAFKQILSQEFLPE